VALYTASVADVFWNDTGAPLMAFPAGASLMASPGERICKAQGTTLVWERLFVHDLWWGAIGCGNAAGITDTFRM
jgi:hypothetical protein